MRKPPAPTTAFARWCASPSAPDRTAGFPSGSSAASSSPSAAPPCSARPATPAKGSTGTISISSPKRIRWAREPPATRIRVPTTIQFPGQPRNRFWEFEEATLALSRIDAATTDLGRLALVEFSTIYGNDWFTLPIPVSYGSMQRISRIWWCATPSGPTS